MSHEDYLRPRKEGWWVCSCCGGPRRKSWCLLVGFLQGHFAFSSTGWRSLALGPNWLVMIECSFTRRIVVSRNQTVTSRARCRLSVLCCCWSVCKSCRTLLWLGSDVLCTDNVWTLCSDTRGVFRWFHMLLLHVASIQQKVLYQLFIALPPPQRKTYFLNTYCFSFLIVMTMCIPKQACIHENTASAHH